MCMHPNHKNKQETPMTNSEVKQVAEDAITTLISNLEQGHSDCLARYLTAMSRFHRYSWSNVLLICLQRATATHVAVFKPGIDSGASFGRMKRALSSWPHSSVRRTLKTTARARKSACSDFARRTYSMYRRRMENRAPNSLPCKAIRRNTPRG